MKTLKTLENERGFSLVELMIAVAVVGLVMAGTWMALQQGTSAYLWGSGRVEVQQSARMAVDRVIRDLRTGSAVTAATTTSITFQYIDDTGATVTVQYSLSGANLQRTQTSPVPAVAQPETVIGNISALTFTYFDKSNVVTTTAANVRVVNIRVTTRPEVPTPMANQQAVFEDRAQLRNL